MKQSTTASHTRGKKSNGTGSNQHRTGSRQSAGRTTSRETSNRQSTARETGAPRSQNGSNGAKQSSDRNSPDRDAGRNSSNRESHSFTGETHLEKFFLAQLKDIYYAEKKIVQSLPKMQEATTTGELRDAFEDHLHQTQRHVKRLEKVFEVLGQKPEGEKCEAIEGIAREVDNIIGETEEGTLTRDAALIIAAQKVEHYEIATYGGLVQLAITMDLHEAADLLDKTLVEEEDTDARLTEIAENEINLRAEHEDAQAGSSPETDEEDDSAKD